MAVGVPENVFVTKLDAAANWARTNSLWPMPFATACCGIELMATASSRHDLARFGAEVMRFTPRQCDLLIVAGRVVMKMLPVLQRIWMQMPEPKWCISMGACACTGGVFDTYAVVQGVDEEGAADQAEHGQHDHRQAELSPALTACRPPLHRTLRVARRHAIPPRTANYRMRIPRVSAP